MFQNIVSINRYIEKSLDASLLRNAAITQNIANVDTPGYKRKDVEFEEVLERAMNKGLIKGKKTHEKHLPVGTQDIDNMKPKLTTDNNDGAMRIDGNNVDIDSEMASLAKNGAKYSTLVQLMNKSYNEIKTAIRGGR